MPSVPARNLFADHSPLLGNSHPLGNSPTLGKSPAPVGPTTSGLAIASLVFALISPFTLFACGLSLVTSIIAIVTGHVSLAKINHSAGRIDGTGIAKIGLIGGYLMLVASLFFITYFVSAFREGMREAAQHQTEIDSTDPTTIAAERMRLAETNIFASGSDGAADGNTLKAKELAGVFATEMKELRETLFTNRRSAMPSFTDGEFLTHCELRQGHCAFIVHVPAYRKFDGDAKETLAQTAWIVAQNTVRSELNPGDRLAVALRGTVLYGEVLIGEVVAEGGSTVPTMGNDRDDLLVFFMPENSSQLTSEATVEPSMEVKPLEQRGDDDSVSVAQTPITPTLPPIPPIEALADTPGIMPGTVSPSPRMPTIVPDTKPRKELPKRPSLDDVIASSEIVREFPEMGWEVKSLAFSPKRRWLAVGKMDRMLLILDLDTGATLCKLDDLDDLGQVTGVEFSPDGTSVIATGYSGSILTWQINVNGLLTNPKPLVRHEREVESFVVSANAPFIMTGSSKGELIWQSYAGSTSNSRTLQDLKRGVLGAYLPKAGLEAMASDGQSFIRFDLKTAQRLSSTQLNKGIANAAAFSDDGTQLAVSKGYEIEIWDTVSGACRRKIDTQHEIQWSLKFVPNSDRLMSGGRGKVIQWDTTNGQPICRFDLEAPLYVRTLALSADSKWMATIPASAGQSIKVFQLPE